MKFVVVTVILVLGACGSAKGSEPTIGTVRQEDVFVISRTDGRFCVDPIEEDRNPTPNVVCYRDAATLHTRVPLAKGRLVHLEVRDNTAIKLTLPWNSCIADVPCTTPGVTH